MVFLPRPFPSEKQFLRPNRNHRFESWGSDASLDTNIGKIDRCHILMSYASFDVICVIWCQMTHMTSKYCISQFGWSWCLKKRWVHSFTTCCFALPYSYLRALIVAYRLQRDNCSLILFILFIWSCYSQTSKFRISLEPVTILWHYLWKLSSN